MKFGKFIIPVSISLAAFLWGYRGELWLGKVDSDANLGQSPKIEHSAPNVASESKPPVSAPNNTASAKSTALAPPGSQQHPVPGGPPIKAKELPVSPGEEGDDYAPEDDGQTADEDAGDASEDTEEDQEEDQALPDDEPGADDSANEEVDSDSNEGDLQTDETADTADTKPVKP